MSTATFPVLTGLSWSMLRTAQWSGRIQENVSGKEVRVSDWSYPKYQWTLAFEGGLRQGKSVFIPGDSYTDMASLVAFYNSRQGQVDSFLYSDQDDNTVTSQAIGLGDGATKIFQLVKLFGGYAEPVFAPNVVTQVRVSGTPTSVTVGLWDLSNVPGTISFASAPSSGATISADFSYYYPCRFVDNSLEFEKILQFRYIVKKLSFISIK